MKKTSKLISILLALVMCLSCITPAFAADLNTAGGTVDTPVVLNVEPAIFSVTIPTGLPVEVNASGGVWTADDAKIINNSHGPVEVVGMTIEAVNGWTIANYAADLRNEKVDSNQVGMVINNCQTAGADAIAFDAANFNIMMAKNDSDTDECAIEYYAKVTPLSEAFANTIANVVFTIEWYTGDEEVIDVSWNFQNSTSDLVTVYNGADAYGYKISDWAGSISELSDLGYSFTIDGVTSSWPFELGTNLLAVDESCYVVRLGNNHAMVAVVLEDEYNYNGLTVPEAGVYIFADNVGMNASFSIGVDVHEPVEITDSWEEIEAELEAGTYAQTYSIGDYKTMTLSSGETVEMQIVAFDADQKFSGSGAAAITWLSRDLLTTHNMNSTDTNAGGWEASEMRSWLSSDVFSAIPEEVKNMIVKVDKTYYDCTTKSTKTVGDLIWIPSAREIGGPTIYSAYGWSTESSGPYYGYCADLSVAQKNLSGSASSWWLRSSCSGCSLHFSLVSESGTIPYYGNASYSTGVAIGFCTSSKTGETITLTNDYLDDIGYTDETTDLVIPEYFWCEKDNCYYRITAIGDYAFQNCTNLVSVYIPSSVTEIGDCAFDGCTNLENIVFGESVSTFGLARTASTNNNSALTTIGNYAFRNCTSLTSVTLPDSVTSVDYDAFHNCTNLTAVYIDDLAAWCGITFGGDYSNPLYYAKNLYLSGELVTNLVIPDGITSIKNYAFQNCTSLITATMPDGVTSIGNYAFSGCSSLTKMDIPNSVTRIGSFVFSNCTSLTEMVVPDSVASIGSGVFSGCYNIESISTPYVFKYPFGYLFGPYSYSGSTATKQYGYTYYVADSLKNVTITGGALNYYAFGNFTNLKSVAILDGVTSIGGEAFRSCTSLESVIIPDSVASIGTGVFSGCYNIESISTPYVFKYPFGYLFGPYSYSGSTATKQDSYTYYVADSLKNVTITSGAVGDYAFQNFKNLESMTIGKDVTSIGKYAFNGCADFNAVYIDDMAAWCGIQFNDVYSNPLYSGHNLYLNGALVTNLVIPDNVTTINNYAFEFCTSLTSVDIPDSVTVIGDSAFRGCTSLTNIEIPDGVTSIGDYAFQNCRQLESIVIPNSVTSMGSQTFWCCTSLKSVIIPDNVTAIGAQTFYGCTALESVVIGSNVTSIGSSAFSGCTSLGSVTIPDSVTTISNYAFEGCTSLGSVTIPDGVTSIGREAFYNCTALESVTIPDSVTSIGSNAFDGCTHLNAVYINDISVWCGVTFDSLYSNPLPYAKNLYLNGELVTDLVIPDGVAAISDYAFYDCDVLESVVVPGSVATIGNDAFHSCDQLTSVTMHDGLGSILGDAFSYCTNLTSVVIPDSVRLVSYDAFEYCTSLTEVVMPAGIVTIESYTFRNCTSLTSVTIQDSVKYIRSGAFESCTALKTINYTGSSDQWSSIGIDSNNTRLLNATINYNYTIE